MNEFYLPKKSVYNQQYLLEQQTYHDIYEYNKQDTVTLKMLMSVILNDNQHLFVQLLKKKVLTLEDTKSLLLMICEEGDSSFFYFNILFDKSVIDIETFTQLVEKALISNSINILKSLISKDSILYLNIESVTDSLSKNPSVELLNFLCRCLDKSLVLNDNLLNDIFNNDYIKMFIYYTDNQLTNDWSNYLHVAISKNAYDIINFILSKIDRYYNKKQSQYYNDFFDYLITEPFDTVICFLNKSDNISDYGIENIEKLLHSFQDNNDFELLLFCYKIIDMPIKDTVLQQKIDKYILHKKLLTKLKIKNQKDKKKI